MGEWLLSRKDRLIVARHEYLFSVLSRSFSLLSFVPDHTVPYGTVLSRDGFPRHFVPGYDRCRPSGTRWQTFRNSI